MSRLRGWLVQFVLPVAAAAALLALVIGLGGQARKALSERGAGRVPFTAVDCDPPPGLSRQAFLEEVQYLGRLPDEVDLLDDEVTHRVRAAFAAHPWVREVATLERGPGRLGVGLLFRRPVLYVESWGRALDADAVLLPKVEAVSGLFIWRQKQPAPGVPPGRRCVTLARPAAVAAALLEWEELRGGEIAGDGQELTVRAERAVVRLGQEPIADAVERLRRQGALAGWEWDVRGGTVKRGARQPGG